MKRIIIGFFVLLLSLPASAQYDADIKTIWLGGDGKIDENDTLLAGAYSVDNTERFAVLFSQLLDLDGQRMSVQDRKDLKRLEEEIKKANGNTPTKVDAETQEMINTVKSQIASVEKEPASNYAQQAKSKKCTPEEAKQAYLKHLQRMLASLQGATSNNSKANSALQQQYERLKERESADAGIKTKMYAVKRQMAALMVDGKLHDYAEIRQYRHGRVAVAVWEQGTDEKRLIWGFADKQMRLVIPCQYTKVYDFNNANFRKQSVYDPMEDEDTRGWTSVIDRNYQMGMIDRDGNVKIPCRFTENENHKIKIKFISTPWGEYAGVYRGGKEGIIDRNGNYTLAPTYEHLVWYDDLQCFGTTGSNRIYFDHKGNRLSK